MSRDAPRNRLVALDALRGVAAVVVLVHHVSMTAPSISAAYSSSSNVAIFSTAWWVTLSPLKILFAGPEFVSVFFVLSGFVLVLTPLRRWPLSPRPAPPPAPGSAAAPAESLNTSTAGETAGAPAIAVDSAPATATTVHPHGYDWLAYYPRRILRLAIPVVVSVGLAALWILLVPRTGDGGAWMAKQGSPDLGLGNLLREASIVGYTGRPDVTPVTFFVALDRVVM